MIHGKAPGGPDNYETPDYLYNELNRRFAFTVDAAATEDNCRVTWQGQKRYFKDAFAYSWAGHRVFCNPPYSEKKKWIERAKKEVLEGCPLVVMPLPFTMEVYREVKGLNYEVLDHRVSFIDAITKKPVKGNSTGTINVFFFAPIKRV